jgi:insertion element IS1 protein InsB
VNQAVLQQLNPEQVEVDICLVELLKEEEGTESELDEMWSYVGKKANPRWLWHAIDHRSGKVLAYVFGRRKDEVLLQLKELLELFGIIRYYTDGLAAYERHLEEKSMRWASSICRRLKASISICEPGLNA